MPRSPQTRRAVIIACLMVGACTPSADTSSNRADSATHAAVTDSLVGPGVREGVWQDVDERSTWRAVLDGPRIVQIDEKAVFADSARSERTFRFDSSGTLMTVLEDRQQLIFGATAAPDTLRTRIELEWQRDSLVRSAKRVDGVDRLLQPYEVDNFRAHASELLSVVRAGTTPSPTEKTP